MALGIGTVTCPFFNMKKSLFANLTFWGILFSVWLSLSPSLQKGLEKGFSVADWFSISNSAIATLLTIISRMDDSSVLYTPKGVPGRDPDDDNTND